MTMFRLLVIVFLSLPIVTNATPSKRVIALAPHIVEMLYAIEAGDTIVGTTDYADYPEQAKSIPRIANHAKIQIEQVVALNPDLIISWKSGNPSDDIEKLKSLGFKVVYSQPIELSDIAKELLLFGKLTGHERQAESVASNFMHQLINIQKKQTHQPWIRGFYEAWSNPLSTVAGDAWPQKALEVCRVENPFKESASHYPQVSLEQVIEFDPQIIIQPSRGNKAPTNGIEWNKWPSMTAVQKKQFVFPNADEMHRMTPRTLSAVESLCDAVNRFRKTEVH